MHTNPAMGVRIIEFDKIHMNQSRARYDSILYDQYIGSTISI